MFHPSVYPFIHPSIHSSIHPFIHPFIHLSIHPPTFRACITITMRMHTEQTRKCQSHAVYGTPGLLPIWRVVLSRTAGLVRRNPASASAYTHPRHTASTGQVEVSMQPRKSARHLSIHLCVAVYLTGLADNDAACHASWKFSTETARDDEKNGTGISMYIYIYWHLGFSSCILFSLIDFWLILISIVI